MKSQRRKTKCCLIAIGAVLLALLAQPALAVTKQWVGPNPNTNWSTAGNWSPAGAPLAGDIAFLRSTTGSKTATLNVATPQLSAVVVDAFTVPGTFTVNQSSGSTALNAAAETIGDLGTAVYNQSGGSNTVGGANTGFPPDTIDQTLVLGFSSTGNGTYNKSGGSLTAGALVVGLGGTGTFKQSSGNVTIGAANPDTGQPFSLILGGFYNSGSPIIGTGSYTMSSGNLTVGSGEVVGQTGTGTFTQSAGTHTVNGLLSVGNQTGSTGTFTKSSGTLNVTGDEYIGASGTGNFTMSSGTNTVGGEFNVGRNGTSNGTFKMSSGSLSVTGNEIIGGFGPGTFTQTSGSNTTQGNFTLGDNATGIYTMTSGSLSVKGDEIIGNNGAATFTQTSGSNSAKTINIAKNAPATYTLTSGSVTATDPAKPADAIHINGPYDGSIPSATGGNFLINGTATVNGNVTNDGLVKTSNATVTWNGVVTNNSAYVSDPGSTQTFSQDLVVNQNGYLKATAPLKNNGTANDKFILKEDFVITADNTQESNWDTHLALLNFNKGTDKIHDLSVAGKDQGQPGVPGGPSNVKVGNYAWGSLDITNQIIDLVDANTTVNKGALYVNYLLTGVDIISEPGKAANINGPSGAGTFALNIYYNPDVNSYLAEGTYDYNSGKGQLIPYHTPLPPSVLLLGSGLLGMGLLGYRRKRLMG